MKTLMYLFIILIFSNCNDREKTIPKKSIKAKVNLKLNALQTRVSDSKIDIDYQKTDTLTKSSEVFKINGINCYWEFILMIHPGDKSGNSILNLKNSKTNKILLSNPGFTEKEQYRSTTGHNFDFKENFKDANFDGLQDFIIYSWEDSGSGGAYYNAYLFNKSSKTFVLSKELSGGEFEINKTDKTVSTYWKSGVGWNSSKVDHFGKNGNIKFTEITTREVIGDTTSLLKTTYTKTVNGKIIKTKIDTTKFEGY